MRRTVMACGAVILVLAGGCSGDGPGPDPTAPPSSEPGGSGEPSSSPSVSESPEPFDPQQVDLAEQEWQFSTVYQDPVDVPLEGGEATGEFGQWEGKFELGEDEPLYVDIDDDGDQDVVASMSFSFETAPETYQWVATTWFVWLNDGEQLTQLPYPLAGSGDCDTQVDSVTKADDVGVVIDEAQMGWQSACAEGAGIEVTRTVQVSYDTDDRPWLVQTDPFPSWGGACPMMVEPSDSGGEVRTAPGLEPASPEVNPVIVTSGESWIGDEVEDWDFVTYLQEEDPNFVSYCGWTQRSN